MLWVVGGVLLNALLHVVDASSGHAFVRSLLSLNIFLIFAGFVVVRRIVLSDAAVEVGASGLAFGATVMLAVCVTGLAGYRADVGLAASVVAIYILVCCRSDGHLRAAGVTLLALSINLVWAPMVAQVVMPEILWLDAVVVSTMLRAANIAFVQKGASFFMADDHTLNLVAACSSFGNLSMAMLSFAAAVMALRTRLVQRDLVVMGLVCLTMILFNAVRICLFALGPEQHAYWHDGEGAPIIALVTTTFVMLASFAGALWASRDLEPLA